MKSGLHSSSSFAMLLPAGKQLCYSCRTSQDNQPLVNTTNWCPETICPFIQHLGETPPNKQHLVRKRNIYYSKTENPTHSHGYDSAYKIRCTNLLGQTVYPTDCMIAFLLIFIHRTVTQELIFRTLSLAGRSVCFYSCLLPRHTSHSGAQSTEEKCLSKWSWKRQGLQVDPGALRRPLLLMASAVQAQGRMGRITEQGMETRSFFKKRAKACDYLDRIGCLRQYSQSYGLSSNHVQM